MASDRKEQLLILDWLCSSAIHGTENEKSPQYKMTHFLPVICDVSPCALRIVTVLVLLGMFR